MYLGYLNLPYVKSLPFLIAIACLDTPDEKVEQHLSEHVNGETNNPQRPFPVPLRAPDVPFCLNPLYGLVITPVNPS